MAAEYHVRIEGRVHGPFSGKQLKKLAAKGQITEEAEVGTSAEGPWFSATKVAGLFGGAKSGTSASAADATSSSDSHAEPVPLPDPEEEPQPAVKRKPARKSASSSTREKPSRGKKSPPARKKARKKATVDAEAVFDLDDSDDDIEFEEDEDDLFEDAGDFESDDELPVRRPSRGRGRSRSRRSSGRSRGTSWGQVRVGLLLLAIGVCLFTGAFALQALGEVIGGLLVASGKFFPGRGTAKLLEMASKGSVLCNLFATICAVIGASFAILLPADKGAKGLAIAMVATFGVHLLTFFQYVVEPMVDGGAGGGGFGVYAALFEGGGDFEMRYALIWGPYFAGLILLSCTLWAIAELKKDYNHGSDCTGNILFIGLFVGMIIVSYVIAKLELMPSGGGRAMLWLMMLVRLGHLSLLGIFLGRLIGQVFHSRDSV